ncbi:MAG: hypothetical protein JNN12_08335 [Bacteroidetes Order II. Incertae sedis bacterium]|nr:hypothetical protein [Bacteroidetes Order II. bacterium]
MQYHATSGFYLNRKAYFMRLLRIGGVLLVVLIAVTAIAPHVFVSLLMFITSGVLFFALSIFFRSRDMAHLEIFRNPEGQCELNFNALDFSVANPSVVYFGVSDKPDGKRFLCLGIPSGTRMAILEEEVVMDTLLPDVPKFELPPSTTGKPLTFQSRTSYPGDLREAALTLGFI